MKKKCKMRDSLIWDHLCKLVLIMKFTSLFLLLFVVQLSASVYSQQTRINVDFNQATLKEVIEKIEDQTNMSFFYSGDVLNVDRKVTLKSRSMLLDDVLLLVSKQTGLTLEILDDQILVKSGNPVLQKKTVSGIVTDNEGMPLPGVTVVLKGTTHGTITDGDGNYSISNVTGEDVLVFSFVGMKAQEISADGKTIINVVMVEDAIGIEEVVAVGYGTMKKSDLTGSVGSVSHKDIGDRVVSDIGQLIQGKVAGVDVSKNKIRIRGVTTFNNTDPLIVIDGFMGESLSTVNPNDIESIEILKDASSTAIYGSRGANGVILVSTKNGKAGPLKVNINAFYGIDSPSKKLNMLNSNQYIDYAIDALTNANFPINDKFYSSDVRVDNTDWQDALTRTSPVAEFNVNFSGGSENSTFLVSLGYNHHESVVINPSYDEANIRIKNQFNIKKWLRAGENISLSYSYSKGALPSTLRPYYLGVPYMQIRDENNYWGYSVTDRDLSGDAQNAYASAQLSHPKTNTISYQTNLWAEIEPFKGLVYRIQAGVTGSSSRYTSWNDQYQDNNGTTILNNYAEKSSYGIYPIIESYLTYSNTFGNHEFKVMVGNTWQDYARSGGIGIYGEDFSLSTVKNVFQAKTKSILNQDYIKYARLSYFGRLNYQYNNRYLLTVNLRRDSSPRFAPHNRWGTFPSVALAWKMSEEDFIKNLNLFDILKLRTSWGISGNDAIGDFRYSSQVWTSGVYTAVGESQTAVQGATVLLDASQDIKWESTKSTAVGVDMAFLKNSLSITSEYFIKNTNDILFAVPRATSLGYGTTVPGNAIVNAASCENKGFELQVGYKNKIGELFYSVNANYTNVTNKVTSLGEGQPYLDGFNRTELGYPIGYLYGYVAQGIYMTQAELDAANQSARDIALAANPDLMPADLAKIFYQNSTTAPGDVKFEDLDGDGIVTGEDRTMIGNSIPKHIYGFSIDLNYKGFDLNADFQGVAGNDIYTARYISTRGMSRLLNQETWILDRWRSEADPGNGIVPRAIIGDPNGNWSNPSTLFVSSGDYLKLKQLSIGYTFPERMTSKMGLTNLRIYTSGYNLLTLTKYQWFDPEISTSNLSRAQDYSDYPSTRTISLGIQVGL